MERIDGDQKPPLVLVKIMAPENKSPPFWVASNIYFHHGHGVRDGCGELQKLEKKKFSNFLHANIKSQYNMEVLKIFDIRGFYVSFKECKLIEKQVENLRLIKIWWHIKET